jgi:hypothetical protein
MERARVRAERISRRDRDRRSAKVYGPHECDERHTGKDQARLALPVTLRVVGSCITLITGRVGDSFRTGISAAIQVTAKTDVQAIFVQHRKPTLGLAKVQLLSASRIGAEAPVEPEGL